MADNAYTGQTISGYNASPPPDDDTTSSANQVEWQKHLDKIGGPVKVLSEAINTAAVALGAASINNGAGQANTLGGTIGYTTSQLTISSGSITPTATNHTVDTESDASTDVLITLATGSVNDRAVVALRAESAARVVTVDDATGNINLANNTNVALDLEVPLVLQRNGSNWEEISRPIQALETTSVPNFTGVSLKSQKRQSFVLNFWNSGGTLKHRIGGAQGPAVAGNFHDKISGASTTFTTTPTATDSSTAMAAGGKMASGSTSQFIFDTAAQVNGDIIGQCGVNQALIAAGTIITVSIATVNSDVNGTTRNRLAMTLFNAAGGAAYALTSLASGDQLTISFDLFLA